MYCHRRHRSLGSRSGRSGSARRRRRAGRDRGDGAGSGSADPTVEATGADDIAQVLSGVVDAGPPADIEQGADPALVAVVRDDNGGLSVRRIELTDETDLAQVADDVAASGTLVAASFDAEVTVDEPEGVHASEIVAATTNDPFRSQQWALDRVPFETAWTTTNGRRSSSR